MENTLSISELENTFIEDLNMLGDWFFQYEYLLEISADLPHIPEQEKTEKNRVPGCQSGVWLVLSFEDGKVKVLADSDALIIRGILSIIVSVLDGRTPEEIVKYEPHFIEETNLREQISTDRFRGIQSVIKSIQQFADKQRQEAGI